MDSRGDLTIETEQGVVVDSLGVYIGDLCAIIEQLAPENLNATHCLQYIDPTRFLTCYRRSGWFWN
jgi:hypothetical protein